MNSRKTISPVVATALLIVTAVVAVVSFQNWFGDFSSGIFTNVEQQNILNSTLKLETISGNILYVSSGKSANISVLKISNSNNIVLCEYYSQYNDNELKSYWSFENTNSTHVFDDSGYNNTGTLYANTYFGSGLIGNGAKFDNSVDKIIINASPSLDTNSEITITSWIKSSTYDTTGRYIVAYYNSSSGTGVHTSIGQLLSNNQFVYSTNFVNNGGASAAHSTSPNNFSIDSWHFLVSRSNFSEKSVYVDSNKYTFGGGITDLDTSYDVWIGNNLGASPNSFNGTIDEVRIYNRSLSDNEISNLYNFNSNELNLTSGLNQIPITGCNLTYGELYDVTIFTNSQKAEAKIFAR